MLRQRSLTNTLCIFTCSTVQTEHVLFRVFFFFFLFSMSNVLLTESCDNFFSCQHRERFIYIGVRGKKGQNFTVPWCPPSECEGCVTSQTVTMVGPRCKNNGNKNVDKSEKNEPKPCLGLNRTLDLGNWETPNVIWQKKIGENHNVTFTSPWMTFRATSGESNNQSASCF